MTSHIYNFYKSQKCFSVLSVFFAAFLAAFFLNHFIDNIFINGLQLIGGLFFMIVGTGISITIILQKVFKRNFDLWEFLSISILGGMLISPVILNLEYVLLSKAYDWYPIANSIALWIAATYLLYFEKTSLPVFTLRNIHKKPVLIVLAFGTIFTSIQVLMYRTLPDLDPYKWLLKYIYQFTNQQLDYLERPLFGAMTFIATRFTNLDIFTFFKYVFPFFFLFSLVPAWMVARNFSETKKQWVFLLFLFTSPVVLLYAQTPMPQAPFIMLSYFFIFFLLYSIEKQDDFFFYIAGFLIFLSFFYHQAGIIIFAVWAIMAVWMKRKILFADRKATFWIFLVLISNLSFFEKMYQFLSSWTTVVIARIFAPNNLNLLYPAYYSNVDRNNMGWGSLSGVIQFYGFHMGPLVGILLLLTIFLLFKRKDLRRLLKDKIKSQGAFAIIFSIFLLFFTIAEILPRFPNVALLPDRAWIFCGIFSFALLYILLNYVEKIPRWIMVVFTISLIVGLSGAMYVNYLKSHLATPAQWESAQWIKKNLPEDRIFLSYGHKNLLPLHSESALIRIPSKLYCSKNVEDFQNTINLTENANKIPLEEYYGSFLEYMEQTAHNSLTYYKETGNTSDKYRHALLTTNAFMERIDELREALKEKTGIAVLYPTSYIPVLSGPTPIEDVYDKKEIISIDSIRKRPFYIYYARESLLNPYRSRPYEMQNWGIDPCSDGKFLFDLYPDKFEKIYSENNDEVIIWKVL